MELPQCETYVNPDPPYDATTSCCPTGQGINQIGICVCLNGSLNPGCDEGGGEDPPGNPPTPVDPGGGPGNPPDPDPDPPDPEDPEDPENPSLEVECSPEVVERGQPASCSALLSSGTMENLSWSFSGGTHTLSDLGSDNPLVGVMAVSGTVTATATVDGEPLTGDASITVTPRDWPLGSYNVVIQNLGPGTGPDALPPIPIGFHQFGDFSGKVQAAGDASAVVHAIHDGPNAGLFFLTDVPPLAVYGEIRINYPAFETGSDFMNWQTGGQYCTAAEVQALLPLVEAHEGLNKGPNSHARWFEDQFNQVVGETYESVVATIGNFGAVSAARTAVRNDAQQHAESLHNAPGGLVPPPNCTVNFPLH
jgi:hypothetical protein